MTEHPPTKPPPGFTRFRHGSLPCTVVSDGMYTVGAARNTFPNADPEEIDTLLIRHYLSPEDVRLHQNILVVDVDETLVMFDSGVGTDPELGRKEFGPETGRTIPNLRASGIEPADIDIVALTHAHPDHAWGLTGAKGERLYPNASVAIARADFDYWTDLSRVSDVMTEHQQDQIKGAHKNLTAYQDSLILLDGGEEVATGIRAVPTPGHSPGHMVYEITSEGETMVCWGDLCHHQVLLLEHPEWSFMFDYDGPEATSQRIRIYDMVDQNRQAVFGYHFPFPGLGHLRRDQQGYTWIPADLPLAAPETSS